MTDPLKVYKALADETRLRLIRLLVRGALNVNEIIGILGMGQSRISRHLKILSEAELVTKRREGTWIYYEGNGQSSEPIVVEALEMCERHERAMPNYTEDLQGLENVVEGRRQQMRNFFDNIKDPDQLQQALDGNYYRKIAIEQVPEGAGQCLIWERCRLTAARPTPPSTAGHCRRLIHDYAGHGAEGVGQRDDAL